MSNRYDVIVIGGGHNGLVSAGYLAKAGGRVLVLEARDTLGGLAGSEEFSPGFFCDTGAHYVNTLQAAVVKDLSLTKIGLTFQESQAKLFAPQKDGPALTLWQDLARSCEEIAALSEKDAVAYPAHYRAMQGMSEVLQSMFLKIPPDLMNRNIRDIYQWGGVAFGLKRMGRQPMMEFLRVLPLPVFDLLNEWFEHPLLKGVLAGGGVCGLDVGPRAAGTAMMYLYQGVGGLLNTRTVSGGMKNLVSALESSARSLGVKIQLTATVSEILTREQNGKSACGIKLQDGETLLADTIVSNVDPRRTLFDLLGPQHLEPGVMRQVRNIDYKGATARLDLALDALPEFTGQKNVEQLKGRIRICPDMDYLEKGSDDCKYGRFSSRPYLEITIPTLDNKNLAPAGKHVFNIDMQYAPYHLRETDWVADRQLLVSRIVDTLEDYAPGIKQQIIDHRLMTPLDFEQQYGLSGGCIHHGRMAMDQMLMLRPIPAWSRYRMPVKGLYLCGAGNHPGGGITGAPGYNAAQAILADKNLSQNMP